MHITFRQSLAAAAGAAALLLAPAAMAAGAYHPSNDTAGAAFFPEHVTTKSRADVNADLAAAKRQPGWNAVSRGAPWPAPATGAGLTRAQVNADLQAAMAQPAWDSVSRVGAAWPAQGHAPGRSADSLQASAR